MKSGTYKLYEFVVLFVIIPISFVLDYPLVIKMLIGFFGFLYVVVVLLRVEKKEFKIAKGLHWKTFCVRTSLKFVAIIAMTIVYVWIMDQASLFLVVVNNPWIWFVILFVYSLLSVYPQELVFRTFYFQRYETLFKSKALLVFINAIVFSLAHLFFRNTLVLILTFIGGLLFALTYYKSKSTLLVTIEHAIYGCWLYTVGMGEMLGFPTYP